MSELHLRRRLNGFLLGFAQFEIVERLEAVHGPIDVLINNAGVAVGMVAVFLFVQISPSFVTRLTLDVGRIRAGEVWRLFSFILLPTSRNWLWFLFGVLWFTSVGQALEDRLGAFRFNVYYLLGMLGTRIAANYLTLPLFYATTATTRRHRRHRHLPRRRAPMRPSCAATWRAGSRWASAAGCRRGRRARWARCGPGPASWPDRKSTRLNSSHRT